MHRTEVRVVEDALGANNTIASASRSDFDRADVTVVNLMSAAGAGKTALLERGLYGLAARACASACWRATCRAASTPTACRSWTSRRCSSGACDLAVIDEVDLLGHLEFDFDRLEANIRQINHEATVMRVGAKTGEGIDAFRTWLKELPARVVAEAAHDHDHDREHHDHADHEHTAA